MESTLSHTKASYLLTNPAPTGLCYNNLITGAIIFHPTSTNPRILLFKRAAHESTSSNVFEIPGGKVEDSDLTIFDGLKREVHEETGLKVERVEGMMDSSSHAVEKSVWNGEEEVVVIKLSLQLNFVVGVVDDAVRVCAEEHCEGIWVGREEMEGLVMTGEMRGVVEDAFRWKEGRMDEETVEEVRVGEIGA